MPRGSGTGPRGQGARTGRGMGGCGTGTGQGQRAGRGMRAGRMSISGGTQSGAASGGQQRSSTESYSNISDWRSLLSSLISKL